MSAVDVIGLEITVGCKGETSCVIKDLSLTVEPGEALGVIGATGSGKSLFLRTLAGVGRNWQGEITLFGRPIIPQGIRDPQTRRRVQMLFRDPGQSLHPLHEVRRILSEPLQILAEPNIDERIDEMLVRVGVGSDRLDRRPAELTPAQQQRVALARLLLLDPDLVLLDDPAAMLEGAARAGFLDLLGSVIGTRTVIMASREPAMIAAICPRQVELRDGRLLHGM